MPLRLAESLAPPREPVQVDYSCGPRKHVIFRAGTRGLGSKTEQKGSETSPNDDASDGLEVSEWASLKGLRCKGMGRRA